MKIIRALDAVQCPRVWKIEVFSEKQKKYVADNFTA